MGSESDESATVVRGGEIVQCNSKDEAADHVLKRFEESRDEAIKRISAFEDVARVAVESAGKETTERLEWRHKTAFDAVSDVLKKVQEAQGITDGLRNEATHALQEHSIEYSVSDNSEFVFGTVKKCIEKKTDCSTLEHFFASMPDDEMHAVAGVMKRCMLTICK